MKKYNVSVVGATGLVGSEIIKVLEETKFPINILLPLASKNSIGKKIEFKKSLIQVEELTTESFKNIDITLFSAGGSISAKFADAAVKSGAIVIDNTSHFRMDKDVPLIVPEVNPQDLKDHKGIIANPNCSTAQLVLPLKPIHDKYKIKRIVVDTYQATSGAGKAAMDELMKQTASILNGEGATAAEKFTRQIAFNLIPQIDTFTDNGFTKEEMKMTNETKKILGDNSIELVATCVRVPVFIGHSEAVHIETEKFFDINDITKIISDMPNLKIMDEPNNQVYPTPLDCIETNDTLIGRIRRDFTINNGISMFIVSNNLRKGAALNAVQIAQRLIKDKLI